MNKKETREAIQRYHERQKRLANKDEILHRTASGEVKLTAQYWETKGQLIRAGDMGALAAFEDEVDEYKRLMIKDKDAPNLTERSVISRIAETKVEKLLINSGYTAEALAAEIGVSEEDILNSDNWSHSKFHSPTGKVYNVVFNYNGSILQEIL